MKTNTRLHLKFFAGPRRGLLHSRNEHLTPDIDQVAEQITRSLRNAGLKPGKEKLLLKVRRFGQGLPATDGIFADGDESFGFFLYGPKNQTKSEIDQFLYETLDNVTFYRAFQARSPDILFKAPVLPVYPELPPPVTVVWSCNGCVPVEHGH